MKQSEKLEEIIEGEECWEMDEEDEAALERAWERERTPEFLELMERQKSEYDEWKAAYLKEKKMN